MRNLSVVIPSKSVSNLMPCIAAVRENEPDVNIIVVDDGLESWPRPKMATVVVGEKPFAFPRNCNVGIRAAGDDDVILLNDDALLKTSSGFTLMQQAAEDHPELGIISATTNVAGNPSQFPKGIGLRAEERTVAFVCVLIPRRTIERVGMMDERFGGVTLDGRRIYGFCDNDYCRRVREAGLTIGIHDGCFVDHGSLRSSFRGDPHASANVDLAAHLYLQKWGDLS